MPEVAPRRASATLGREGVGTPGQPPAKNMVWVPDGEFLMGSVDFYPEECLVHRVRVDGFWMDEHPVTVAEFRRFVRATGHVTCAEREPDPDDYPDADPALLVSGSLAFQPTSGPVDLSDYRNWWTWAPGADWRHPEGPETWSRSLATSACWQPRGWCKHRGKLRVQFTCRLRVDPRRRCCLTRARIHWGGGCAGMGAVL